MKKATTIILAVCTVAVLVITLSFYAFKNTSTGPLNIRTLSKTEPTGHASNLVNINSSDLEELSSLPGIGATLAQRIIDYRDQHGPFTSPAGLLNVPGIGEGTLETILNLITTGGTT